MKAYAVFLAVLIGIMLSTGASAASANTLASNTLSVNLTIYGLPPGTAIPIRYAPNYTTETFASTGYTTTLTLPINASANSTYAGRIPYQWMGAGTTETMNGTIYTMLSSTYTQILNTSPKAHNYLSFYTYLNSSLWTANESAELKQANASLATAELVVKKIIQTDTLPIYNGSTAAGTALKSASDDNGTFTFKTATVQKNPSPACIETNFGNYCVNATTPQKIFVPIIDGRYAFTDNDWYPLNITFQSAFPMQNATFNYSVYDLSNSTYLIPLTTENASSLSVTRHYRIPINQEVEISAGSSGNANYSKQYIDPITFPTDINYYVPINLTNSQTTATPAPFQANIIINESTYANYLTYNGTFANFEILNSTGNGILSSWIENVTNGNIRVWVKLPNGIPASSHIEVYLGFANKTTNLLSSSGTSGIGEAPQLSSTYAEYDDGASVFTNYWNFAGTTTPSGVSLQSGFSVNNGLHVNITSTSSGVGAIFTLPTTYPFIFETYESAIGYGSTSWYSNAWVFDVNPDNSADRMGGAGYWAGVDSSAPTVSQIPALFSITEPSSGTTNNPVWNYINTASGNSNLGSNHASVSANLNTISTFAGTGYTFTATWDYARTRAYPPNGVMPSVTFGAVANVISLSAGAITPPSPTIDSGQSITLTVNSSGGITPYTYQWYTASSSGTCSTSDTAISGATSSTYTASPTSSTYYCYIVTDSDSATADSPTDLITVSPALGTPTISPASATYDAGQTIALTASVSGGTSPYSYQWYNDTSGTASAISGATSSTYTATAGATGTMKYYVKVTDSAYAPESADSSTAAYTVNSALVAHTPTENSPTGSIDTYQNIKFTSNITGGTTPYDNYSWKACDYIPCSPVSGATASTYTFEYNFTPSGILNIGFSDFPVNYTVHDSATTPASSTSPSYHLNVYYHPEILNLTLNTSNVTAGTRFEANVGAVYGYVGANYTYKLVVHKANSTYASVKGQVAGPSSIPSDQHYLLNVSTNSTWVPGTYTLSAYITDGNNYTVSKSINFTLVNISFPDFPASGIADHVYVINATVKPSGTNATFYINGGLAAHFNKSYVYSTITVGNYNFTACIVSTDKCITRNLTISPSTATLGGGATVTTSPLDPANGTIKIVTPTVTAPKWPQWRIDAAEMLTAGFAYGSVTIPISIVLIIVFIVFAVLNYFYGSSQRWSVPLVLFAIALAIAYAGALYA